MRGDETPGPGRAGVAIDMELDGHAGDCSNRTVIRS
jgi:hypothetical protein